MNEVASLELCKELYELSGWHEVETYYEDYPVLNDTRLKSATLGNTLPEMLPDLITPAYSLGYLLRKLPKELPGYQMKDEMLGNHRKLRYVMENLYLLLEPSLGELWVAGYSDRDFNRKIYETADTPEDAVAELAIELFKQEILQKNATL